MKFMPIVWILFTPYVTVPATLYLLSSMARHCQVLEQHADAAALSCSTSDALLTLIPGIANLVPLVFLLSRFSEIRLEARSASALGALRFAIPVMLLCFSGPTVTVQCGSFLPCFVSGNAVFSFLPGIFLWFVTYAVLVGLLVVETRRSRAGGRGKTALAGWYFVAALPVLFPFACWTLALVALRS
jgi:hypothetical protein